MVLVNDPNTTLIWRSERIGCLLIFFPERKEGKAAQLKVLHAKWDAQNGAAKEDAK